MRPAGRGAGFVGEAIGCVAYGVEDVLRIVVLVGEAVDERFGGGGDDRAGGLVDAQGARGVEDDGHVDALVEQRANGGREQADRSRGHGDLGHQHAAEGTLDGDAPGELVDGDGIGQLVDAVGGQDDVGGLRGGGGTARTGGLVAEDGAGFHPGEVAPQDAQVAPQTVVASTLTITSVASSIVGSGTVSQEFGPGPS